MSLNVSTLSRLETTDGVFELVHQQRGHSETTVVIVGGTFQRVDPHLRHREPSSSVSARGANYQPTESGVWALQRLGATNEHQVTPHAPVRAVSPYGKTPAGDKGQRERQASLVEGRGQVVCQRPI